MSSARIEPFEWSGKSVLVTGATGSIGLNLLSRLHSLGAEVHVLIRDPADRDRLWTATSKAVIHCGEINDHKAISSVFSNSEPDVVFHLATPRPNEVADPLRLVEINVSAALGLVKQLALRPSTKLVVTGSSFEYASSRTPHIETDPLYPETWFGTSKAAAGLIYGKAAINMGCQITKLRLFHVYGPWEKPKRLVPTAILAALAGKPLAVTRTSIHRDWIYMEDVIDALLQSAKYPGRGETYNIGSGHEYSNHDVVDAIEVATGRRLERLLGEFQPRDTDTPHRCADISKAGRQLHWFPRRSLADGVAQTLAWHRAHTHFWGDAQ